MKERKFKTNCLMVYCLYTIRYSAHAIISEDILVHEAQSFLDRRSTRTCLIFWSAVWVLNSFYFLHTIFFLRCSFQCWITNSLLFCWIGIYEGASFKSWMLTWCNVKKTKALAQKHYAYIKISIFFKLLFYCLLKLYDKNNSLKHLE